MDKAKLAEDIIKSLDADKEYTKEELNDIIQKAVTSTAAVAENKISDDATLNGENAPSIQDATTPTQQSEGEPKLEATEQNAETMTATEEQPENVAKPAEDEIPEPLDVSENSEGGKVEAIFADGLFNEGFTLGATLQPTANGNVMANVKPSPMDYNKQYAESTKNQKMTSVDFEDKKED